jgi:hypothetical protein
MQRVFAAAVAALLVLCACASGTIDPRLPSAQASVEVTRVTPEPGATLTDDTVFSADVAYTIANFQHGADYYVAPLFASVKGERMTFNAFDRITEAPRLNSASGTLSFRYKVDRELRSPQLARPVRLWLYVMERTGPHTTRVIGQAGPYEYVTSVAQ